MSKQEILPPLRSLPTTQTQATGPTIIPTRVQPGGIFNSTLMRWEAERHARTITAVTGKTKAETDLFDAQALLVDSYRRRQQAVEHLRELPEIIENERAKRRSVRAEELRQVQHKHEVAEVGRMTEIERVETVLVDAQQALRAQREFGYTTYELAWRKKNCEMLDIELNAAERRAILRQHTAQFEKQQERSAISAPTPGRDLLQDALLSARAELLASGLDTTRIDAAIAASNGDTP